MEVPVGAALASRHLRWPNEGANRFGRAGPVSPHRLPIVRWRPATSAPIGAHNVSQRAASNAGRSPAPSADYLMPLALVVHATRPTADVAVAAARRLVASGATRWSAIGQSGGEMRVLTTRIAEPATCCVRFGPAANVLGVVPADAVDARVRVLTVGGRHPLRDPERYPLRIRSVRPVPEVTTLTAVGDIMLGRRVGDRHRADPGAPLKPLAKRLAAAEITSATSSRPCPPTGHRPRAATPSQPARGSDLRCGRPGSTCCPWPTTTLVTTASARCGRLLPASTRVASRPLVPVETWPQPAVQ